MFYAEWYRRIFSMKLGKRFTIRRKGSVYPNRESVFSIKMGTLPIILIITMLEMVA